MSTAYNEFLLEDRGNRARLESDIDKYLEHQENLKDTQEMVNKIGRQV